MAQRKEILVVYEPVPRWGALLEREFVNSRQWELRRCTHVIGLREHVNRPETVACLLVLDESGVSESILPLIPAIASKTLLCMIAPPTSPEIEWLLREAGVDSFLESSISLAQLVRILHRRLQSKMIEKDRR